MSARPLVVGITGASGALYAERLLRFLLARRIPVDLVVSPSGQRLLHDELGFRGRATEFVEYLAGRHPETRGGTATVHPYEDVGATIASGSFPTLGMVVIPCSMKTLAAIANGHAENLLERAADVCLKERRPLVLVPRETPLNRVHLRNLLAADEAGAAIVPAMPGFYQMPQSLDEIADFVVARVVSILGMEQDLLPPWGPGRAPKLPPPDPGARPRGRHS
jgi:4-hydroxy-3-polyprenylbenzoate decarboxylase